MDTNKTERLMVDGVGGDMAWDNAFRAYLRHARHTGNQTPEEALRESWEEQGRRAYRRSEAARRSADGAYLPALPPDLTPTPSSGKRVEYFPSKPQRPPVRLITPIRESKGDGSVPLL